MKTLKNQFLASCTIALVLMLILFSSVNAQETKFRNQSWRVGVAGAFQHNKASLGWQSLHQNLSTGLWDNNFHSADGHIDRVDGTGTGVYAGIFGLYLSDSWWGIQFRICYDERNALINDITQNPIPSFDTKMNYLSFAPSFRVDQHWIPNLSLHVGPFVNVNLTGTFTYKPDKDKSETEPEVDVDKRNIATYGIQGGIAYDIKFAELNNGKNALYLTPFVDCSWLVNQRKSEGMPSQNSITDIWSTLSYRFGVKLSIDFPQIDDVVTSQKYTPITPSTPIVANKVLVVMPEDNVILTKNVTGYFPVHPYVFFDKGSQEIPNRYTLLTKTEAQNFKESDLENFMKGDLTDKETNVNQLMKTYYNVLNIFGDRMRQNPSEKLLLRGSDPEEKEGEIAANKVKNYLVNTFGIDPNRITVEVDPPFKPSGSIYSEESAKAMLADENRRVKFLFSNQFMVKPVEYTIRDEASIDNDMIFFIDQNVPFRSWDVTITGEGKTMYFGPFAYSIGRVNPAEMMRFLESGKYNAKIVITEKSGKKTEENISFKLTKEKELKNAARYLMIFDYNESDAIYSYEKIIKNEIVPGVVRGNKVIIHGHTDIIGTEEGNQILSQQRADMAKKIMDDEFKSDNRNIKVQAIGIGQSKMQYTFDNRYPEGRMYNRNIFVEVIK